MLAACFRHLRNIACDRGFATRVTPVQERAGERRGWAGPLGLGACAGEPPASATPLGVRGANCRPILQEGVTPLAGPDLHYQLPAFSSGEPSNCVALGFDSETALALLACRYADVADNRMSRAKGEPRQGIALLLSKAASLLGKRAGNSKMTPLRHFRVFLSSPGDVSEERDHARKIIKDDLSCDPFLRGRASLDIVSWDDPA
jgi:hypothetical protein